MKARMNVDVEGRNCATVQPESAPVGLDWLSASPGHVLKRLDLGRIMIDLAVFSKHLGSAESVSIWKLEVVVGSRPLQLAHHNGLAFASFKPTGICGRRRSPYHVAVRLMIMNSICCRILIQCVCYCTLLQVANGVTLLSVIFKSSNIAIT